MDNTWHDLTDAQRRMMARVAKRMEVSDTLIVINALDRRTWDALVKRGLVVNDRGVTKFTEKGRAVYESQAVTTPATDVITRLRAELATVTGERDAARAALEPFAKFAGSIKCNGRSDDHEISISDLKFTDGTQLTYVPIAITVGDFRRAAAALDADAKGASDG